MKHPRLHDDRKEKFKLGLCINAPLHGGPTSRGVVHGPLVDDGVRCRRCKDVHRLGINEARKKWEREGLQYQITTATNADVPVDQFEQARQGATPPPTPHQCVRNECAIRGACTRPSACIMLPQTREEILDEARA